MDWTPDPILIQIGPLPLYWYGVFYALGLFVAYQVVVWGARRHYLDASLVANGIIVVAIAALIGGRLYHVIDQWALYRDDPLKIILPPYTGLGVYGGIILGTIVGVLYVRWKRQPLGRWIDVVAPALFVMQAIGRWGNFFNQELYGPPTALPWGIPIDCAHRVAPYLCPPTGTTPAEATFVPLFLYESLSGILGALFLIWLGNRFTHRTRPGDLFLVFLIWYGAVRLLLEMLRVGNWTFQDIPVASIVSIALIAGAAIVLVGRHLRPGPTTADIEAPLRVEAEREATETAAATEHAEAELWQDLPRESDPMAEPIADPTPGPSAGDSGGGRRRS
jgi:phosphatidylglycerol:prolipoprotein diacylglycerol transferase